MLFCLTIFFSCIIYYLISFSRILHCFLPLQIQLMSLSMKPFELFCCLIQFYLCCLSFSNLFLKFCCLSSNLNCKFFYIESQFLYFSLICSSILFQCQIILLFLSSCKCPLFQFFLIPVHFKLILIHFLICFEDHILNVIQSILLISYPLLKLFNFIF